LSANCCCPPNANWLIDTVSSSASRSRPAATVIVSITANTNFASPTSAVAAGSPRPVTAVRVNCTIARNAARNPASPNVNV